MMNVINNNDTDDGGYCVLVKTVHGVCPKSLTLQLMSTKMMMMRMVMMMMMKTTISSRYADDNKDDITTEIKNTLTDEVLSNRNFLSTVLFML